MPRDDATLNPKRNPLLAPAEPTLADVLDRIACSAADPIRRRDQASAVRRFCSLVGREPAMLPARIPDLKVPLERLTPALTGLSAKTIANMKAGLLAALREHAGCQSHNAVRRHLTPAWKDLVASLASQRKETGLSRFVRFCSASGIAPDRVDDHVVDRFMDAVHQATFARKPQEIHRRTTMLWNQAAESVSGWPSQRLTVPSYRKPRWTTPLSEFPARFRQDVEAYLAWLQDPLADPPPRHVCRPQTIISIRSSLERAASAMVLAGKPVTSFVGLADLTTYEAVRAICRHYLGKNGGKPNTTIRLIVTYLVQIADRWTRVPPSELAKLKAIRSRLGNEPPGLTEKNRAMLRQFDDPANLDRLLRLPSLLFSEARNRPDATKSTVKAQLGLALEILLNAPMRGRNLIHLRIDRHLVRSGDGITIVLPAEETKTAEPIEFPLPKEAVEMLDTYLKVFRPKLAGPGSAYLFPSLEAERKLQSTLAGQIKHILFKRAGLRATEHQFRHLCAKLILDAHPGAYGLVQRLLGHKNAKTTLNFYTGMDTARAARMYDGVIQNLRQKQAARAVSRRRGASHA